MPDTQASDLLVTDPADGSMVGRLPRSEADPLVAAASDAHPDWDRTSPSERASMVKAGARRVRDALDGIALLQTRAGGKPSAMRMTPSPSFRAS